MVIGKTAVLIGGASGIGIAVAKALVRNGLNLTLGELQTAAIVVAIAHLIQQADAMVRTIGASDRRLAIETARSSRARLRSAGSRTGRLGIVVPLHESLGSGRSAPAPGQSQ